MTFADRIVPKAANQSKYELRNAHCLVVSDAHICGTFSTRSEWHADELNSTQVPA